MDRRSFLQLGTGLVTTSLLDLTPASLIAGPVPSERKISFYNMYTGEQLKNVVYWAEGNFIQSTMEEINHLFRDRRSNDVHTIDPNLIDNLYRMQEKIGNKQPLHILSAYRCPKTNAMLRRRSRNVAKNSYHMRGQAVDLHLPGTRLSHLRNAARSLRAGGVGYYRRSHFVHIDTGPVRTWGA